MEQDRSYIEMLHKNEKMPDKVYYQLNGKTAQENYDAIKQKQREWLRSRAEQTRHDKEIEKEIEEKLEKTVEKALTDILLQLSL